MRSCAPPIARVYTQGFPQKLRDCQFLSNPVLWLGVSNLFDIGPIWFVVGQIQPLEAYVCRLDGPRQRTHVVRLRWWDALGENSSPQTIDIFRLILADLGENCIGPYDTVFPIEHGVVTLVELSTRIPIERKYQRTSQFLVPYLLSATLCHPCPCLPKKRTLTLSPSSLFSFKCLTNLSNLGHCPCFSLSSSSVSYFRCKIPKSSLSYDCYQLSFHGQLTTYKIKIGIVCTIFTLCEEAFQYFESVVEAPGWVRYRRRHLILYPQKSKDESDDEQAGAGR